MKSLADFKKYILILSGILFLVFLIHLIGTYIYTGGKFIGVHKGSISIGLVGKSPNLKNPFDFGVSSQNNLVYDFLFRSLISYNPHKKIYEGDLAQCDLTTLKKITCTLKKDAIWSDNTSIKVEDIIATFTVFGEKSKNPTIKKFLEGVKIEKTGEGQVVFSSPKNNPLMIEILKYPIIRSDMIDQIKNDRLKVENYISSGPFIYKETVDDDTYKFQRVTFTKNPHYTGTRWLEKLHFKFFTDTASLERAIDTLTVIIPPKLQENINIDPRFDAIKYGKKYEIFGVFFKEKTFPKNIQKIVYTYLYNALYKHEIKNKNHKKITGLLDSKNHQNLTIKTDIQTTMKANGYKTKQMLREEIEKLGTDFSGAVQYEKLKYFSNGGGQAILYTETPEGAVRLTGNIPADITAVKINDYRLQEYKKGAGKFIYKVSTENGTLKPGKNLFHLTLFREGKEALKETLTLYYTQDPEKMKQFQEEVRKNYIATQNTPENKKKREEEKQKKIAKIDALEDGVYYDENGNIFTIKIAFVPGILNEYMELINSVLNQMYIKVETIPLEGEMISKILQENKKPYDIILIGLESPTSRNKILQNFLSSQADQGVNFGNTKNKELDLLIYKFHTTTDEKEIQEIVQKIETFLSEKSLFIPFAQPLHTFYIDKNIKGLTMSNEIQNKETFADILGTVSIQDRYELNLKEKSVSGFFTWISQNFSK